jgi:outer membrane immunogenic protein
VTRRMYICGMTVVCLLSIAATAQESRSEISLQGTGFFSKSSSGNGTAYSSTETGGFLAAYRYHLHRGLSAEIVYGYDHDTQKFAYTSSVFRIQSNIHEATGDLVASLPSFVKGRLGPYVLAGVGALVFAPTGSAISGAQTQAKPVFVYGGGVSYAIHKQVSLRVEYRGLVYGAPDFGLGGLNTNSMTHTAQPSVGLVFHF